MAARSSRGALSKGSQPITAHATREIPRALTKALTRGGMFLTSCLALPERPSKVARLRSSDTYKTTRITEVAGIRLGTWKAEAVAGMPFSEKMSTARANRMMCPTGNPNTSPMAGRNTAYCPNQDEGRQKDT